MSYEEDIAFGVQQMLDADLQFPQEVHVRNVVKNNAQRIRSMTDEELAEWMSVFMRDILSTNDMDDDFEVDPSFAEDMLRWLKQPYGGNGK